MNAVFVDVHLLDVRLRRFSTCWVVLSGRLAFGSSSLRQAPSPFQTPLPGLDFTVAIDGLSAFFLVPVLLVCGLASIYGVQYWPESQGAANARRVSVFLGLMTGALVLLLVAGDGLLFLFGWETMAVSALFLVAAEDDLAETRKAAWLYIAALHFATLSASGIFALLYRKREHFSTARCPPPRRQPLLWPCLGSSGSEPRPV